MKIVHVIDSLDTGGAETLVVNMARAALSAGDECEILTLVPSEGIPHQRAEKFGVPVRAVGAHLYDPRIPIRLRRLTKDADIIHAHLFPAFYWCSVLPGKLVFTEHSTANRRLGSREWVLPEKFVYSRYERVFAISAGVEDVARRYFEHLGVQTDVVLARNGIGNEFYDAKKDRGDEHGRILSVGSLKDIKRHHLAIEAIALIPDVSLSIAGGGPLRDDLEQLSRELEVSERVTFLGEVSDVAGVMAEHDVLLSTSAYEGFSLAAAEAQATGMPVVGPDVPGFNEVVINQETGVLYSDSSPRAIADALSSALDSANYDRLASNAAEHAKQFSISKTYQLQRETYAALVDARA